nr:ribonuclease H-like domain-containing protein [Tanacetum cinerariifolium]
MVVAAMSVVYVFTTPIPKNGENATVEQIRKRAKWNNDDYVCRGLILKGERGIECIFVGYAEHSKAFSNRDVAFWKESINDEMDSAIGNTWVLADLPPGYKPLSYEWIFKIKLKYHTTVDCYGMNSQSDYSSDGCKDIFLEWYTSNPGTQHWKAIQTVLNLKIYEAEDKSSSFTSPTTQNITFVSSQNTDSTNESVSVVTTVSAASTKVLVSALLNVDTLSDTRRNLGANGTTSIGFDMLKVKCYNCHGRGHFARECMSPKDTKNKETQRRNVSVETSTSNALVLQCDGVGSLIEAFRKSQFDVFSYKTGLESVEARIVVYQQNENVFEEDIKLLKLDVMLRDNALVDLRKKFEKAEQERDEFKLKLENFQTSSKNLSQLLASQITNKTILGYDNQVFNSIVFDSNELISSESDVSMPTSPVYDSPTKPNKDLSQLNMPSAPIIEDWVSDSNDESEGEHMPTQKAPSFVQTPEHVKTPRPFVKPVEHPISAENLRRDIPKSRGQRYSWNRKACFVCKSLTHLIKDCGYYEKKMVHKPVRNHAMRGNIQHYARMTHPHPHRHVLPTAVLTRSRLVPLTTARLVTTVVPQTKVQRQRPSKHGVTKAHSPIRRPINLKTSSIHSNFHQKVTTLKTNQVNAVKGVKENWGNPRHALKDKGVIDSGCSRHMTANISYLSDFEEINRGYVAFGGNSKGGKITGKGKIRTGKLDFDDVYFVKELKFNLFSVSQMCDKKNSVLFTDTKCIVLSSDFKLPDENHMLLRVPKENNMYNVDLKNIVLSGDLTCLFAKATLDESNL